MTSVTHPAINAVPKTLKTKCRSIQLVKTGVTGINKVVRAVFVMGTLIYMFLLIIAMCTEIGASAYSLVNLEVYLPTVGEIVKADAVVTSLEGKENGVLAAWLLQPERAVWLSQTIWLLLKVLPLIMAYAAGSYIMGKVALRLMRSWEPSMNVPNTPKLVTQVKVQKAKYIAVSEILPPDWEVPHQDRML